jgi:hypothetical protein
MNSEIPLHAFAYKQFSCLRLGTTSGSTFPTMERRRNIQFGGLIMSLHLGFPE